MDGKRAFDVTVAGIGLVVSAPILLLVALAVWIRMGRPILFTQARAGRGGRPFRIYKFRTMRPVDGPTSPEDDETRITPLGEFLRSTTLDELPELWNVFKGDMSLVGPRPLLHRYVDRYTDEQARRLEVKPGLTSWAVVQGRNDMTWEERFEHDVWYVDHRTFLLDLKILVLTLVQVLRREGVSASDHATMPEFEGEETG